MWVVQNGKLQKVKFEIVTFLQFDINKSLGRCSSLLRHFGFHFLLFQNCFQKISHFHQLYLHQKYLNY